MTGLPSVQFASGLNVNCVVNGLFLTIFGWAPAERGTHLALSSRIWPPWKMLFMTRLVA